MSLEPLIKVAGGKRWLSNALVPLLQGELEERGGRAMYVEPFAGGAAVALALGWSRTLLVERHRGIAALHTSIISAAKWDWPFRLGRWSYPTHAGFLALRDWYNNRLFDERKIARAYYFLNKSCYNGLHRENKQGAFNVPWNKRDRPIVAPPLEPYGALMRDWQMVCGDGVLCLTNKACVPQQPLVIYADPPYDDSFSAYTKDGFRWLDQAQTAVMLRRLVEQGHAVVASNAWTENIVNLYQSLDFSVHPLVAPRRISSDGNRDDVREMIAFAGVSTVRKVAFLQEVECG